MPSTPPLPARALAPRRPGAAVASGHGRLAALAAVAQELLGRPAPLDPGPFILSPVLPRRLRYLPPGKNRRSRVLEGSALGLVPIILGNFISAC